MGNAMKCDQNKAKSKHNTKLNDKLKPTKILPCMCRRAPNKWGGSVGVGWLVGWYWAGQQSFLRLT